MVKFVFHKVRGLIEFSMQITVSCYVNFKVRKCVQEFRPYRNKQQDATM